MIEKTGTAHWTGDLRNGSGSVSTGSDALDGQPYGFATRFEDRAGTNPEELIAAAHASCFAMALAKEMTDAGHPPQGIDAGAAVRLEQVEGGFAVTKSHLKVRVIQPDMEDSLIREKAQGAMRNCPISKLLNAEVTMELTIGAE
jgi:osmotically inducible protein OsmC